MDTRELAEIAYNGYKQMFNQELDRKVRLQLPGCTAQPMTCGFTQLSYMAQDSWVNAIESVLLEMMNTEMNPEQVIFNNTCIDPECEVCNGPTNA